MQGSLEKQKSVFALGLLPLVITACAPSVSLHPITKDNGTHNHPITVYAPQPRIDPKKIRPPVKMVARVDQRKVESARLPDNTHKTPSWASIAIEKIDSETSKDSLVEPADMWSYLRNGFQLPELDNKYVRQFEKAYAHQPRLLSGMLKRARRYLPYITEQVHKRGLPLEIALLPAVESAFKHDAYSKSHAAGLWQFIPATGKRYGLKQTFWYDGRRDVITSTRAALDYLEFLAQEFDGDWFLALSGYNAGENRIHRIRRDNKRRNRSIGYNHLKMSGETRRYVPKLIALRNIIRNPDKYGVKLPPMPKAPYFVEIEAGFQLDLGVVAALADVPEKEIHALNPGLRRWATEPGSSHRVLIPTAAHAQFIAGLQALAPGNRAIWTRHEVTKGDVLGSISSRYNVSIDAIRRANKLKSDLIKIGQNLLIPGSTVLEEQVAAFATDSPVSNPVVVKYRVSEGDTLWNIARRYAVDVSDLANWNNLQMSDILRLEQHLTIYPKHQP